LTQFKHINVFDEKPKYKITGKGWIPAVLAFLIIIGVGFVLDLNKYV
jgi:hypothetical protein